MRQSWRRITDWSQAIVQLFRSYRSNALTAPLWAVALCALLVGYTTVSGSDLIVRYFSLAAFAWSLGYFQIKYNYWQKKDPKKLQSEYHIEEMRKLDIIAKADEKPRIAAPTDQVRPKGLIPDRAND